MIKMKRRNCDSQASHSALPHKDEVRDLVTTIVTTRIFENKNIICKNKKNPQLM